MKINIPGRERAVVRNPRTLEQKFSRFLSDRADSLNISGLEIARRSGASAMNVSRWLTGAASPRLKDMESLAKAMEFRDYRNMWQTFLRSQ